MKFFEYMKGRKVPFKNFTLEGATIDVNVFIVIVKNDIDRYVEKLVFQNSIIDIHYYLLSIAVG